MRNFLRGTTVHTVMRLDVTETAVANIARKGGTAIVDLLEPYG
jgi:hypothetical protein